MARITKELELRIQQKVIETVEKINAHFKIDMPIPPVYYDVTGTTAGLAKYMSMSVHLNPKILLDNIEDSIKTTVPHEVCHLTTFYKHVRDGRPGSPKPHGADWKLMMWVAGASAKVTHEYDVEEIKKDKIEYLYKCNCEKGVKVGPVIHSKIKRGNRYKCKKCNSEIHSGERILKKAFSRASPNGTTRTYDDIE